MYPVIFTKGTLMAAAFVERDWSLSFIYPALAMGVAGGLVWLLLPPEPRALGLVLPEQQVTRVLKPSTTPSIRQYSQLLEHRLVTEATR